MKKATTETQPEHESDDFLIELMGLQNDFPQEALEAYGKIYDRYWEVMLTIAKKKTKDDDAAQDLVADTFNMIYQRAASFKPGKLRDPANVRLSIIGWMSSVMRHVFYDDYLDDAYKNNDRTLEECYVISKKELAIHFDQEYQRFTEEMETLENSLDEPLISLENKEQSAGNLAKVRAYLETLSERDCDIVLTVYDNYAPNKNTPSSVLDELVTKWGTTRENIRKIMQKCRKAIQENLQSTLTFRK